MAKRIEIKKKGGSKTLIITKKKAPERLKGLPGRRGKYV